MNLFGKKKEETSCECGSDCGCGCDCNEEKQDVKDGNITIKILGGGCKKCNELEDNAKAATKEVGVNIDIQHVSDFTKIAEMGVMVTPALVINEKVVSSGKVLRQEQIVKILGEYINE